MKIRHRIVFDKNEISAKFIGFLKERGARLLDDGSDLVVAYIFEDNESKNKLYQYMDEEGLISFIDRIYSKKEMELASWFRVRSKYRWEYPQPENEFHLDITYESGNYCNHCGSGLKQINEFRVNKNPKWGKRNFLMLNWVEDELFISDYACDVLEKSDVKGFRILGVTNHKLNKPMVNIKQIYVENILEFGLEDKEQSIEETLFCKKCEGIKYIYTGRGFTYKKDIFEGLKTDIAKSSEVFGDGVMCARLIFISKEFYKLLVANSIDKDLDFEPILLE